MTPSFTRGEYWLLETSIESGTPIGWVFDQNADVILNKEHHGLTGDELLDAFESLFGRGLIRVEVRGRRLCTLHRKTLIAVVTHRLKAAYWVTAEGGAAWEEFARPNWDEYIPVFGYWSAGSSHEECCSLSRERLEAYLALAKEAGYVLDSSGVQWDVVRPWEATYWKVFPMAYRLQFPSLSAFDEVMFLPSAEREFAEHRMFGMREQWVAWGSACGAWRCCRQAAQPFAAW